MYVGLVAILAFFTVSPIACELAEYLYTRQGGGRH